MADEIQLTLTNELRELARVHAVASPFLEANGVAGKALYVALLALEETLSNVIRHGFADQARHEIAVSLRVRGGGVELTVVDDGQEFDPTAAPEVDLDAPLEERQAGGLGIHLVRQLASEVRFQRKNGRNQLLVRI
jgi:serine/threonine-protein kinase RsbW